MRFDAELIEKMSDALRIISQIDGEISIHDTVISIDIAPKKVEVVESTDVQEKASEEDANTVSVDVAPEKVEAESVDVEENVDEEDPKLVLFLSRIEEMRKFILSQDKRFYSTLTERQKEMGWYNLSEAKRYLVKNYKEELDKLEVELIKTTDDVFFLNMISFKDLLKKININFRVDRSTGSIFFKEKNIDAEVLKKYIPEDTQINIVDVSPIPANFTNKVYDDFTKNKLSWRDCKEKYDLELKDHSEFYSTVRKYEREHNMKHHSSKKNRKYRHNYPKNFNDYYKGYKDGEASIKEISSMLGITEEKFKTLCRLWENEDANKNTVTI